MLKHSEFRYMMGVMTIFTFSVFQFTFTDLVLPSSTDCCQRIYNFWGRVSKNKAKDERISGKYWMLKMAFCDVFKCSLYVFSTVATLETYPQPKEMHLQTPDVICITKWVLWMREVLQGADLEPRFSCRSMLGLRALGKHCLWDEHRTSWGVVQPQQKHQLIS